MATNRGLTGLFTVWSERCFGPVQNQHALLLSNLLGSPRLYPSTSLWQHDTSLHARLHGRAPPRAPAGLKARSAHTSPYLSGGGGSRNVHTHPHTFSLSLPVSVAVLLGQHDCCAQGGAWGLFFILFVINFLLSSCFC